MIPGDTRRILTDRDGNRRNEFQRNKSQRFERRANDARTGYRLARSGRPERNVEVPVAIKHIGASAHNTRFMTAGATMTSTERERRALTWTSILRSASRP
jgi:hypothetical protein